MQHCFIKERVLLHLNCIWKPRSITVHNSFTVFLPLFTVRDWEKKGGLSPASEGRGSKPSFTSYLYLSSMCGVFFCCFFSTELDCKYVQTKAFKSPRAPKDELTRHVCKGRWTLMDRSNCSCQGERCRSQTTWKFSKIEEENPLSTKI